MNILPLDAGWSIRLGLPKERSLIEFDLKTDGEGRVEKLAKRVGRERLKSATLLLELRLPFHPSWREREESRISDHAVRRHKSNLPIQVFSSLH